MSTANLTNSNFITSTDRAVAGNQPDGSTPSGGTTGAGGASGTQAPLPDYTSGGTTPVKINVLKPAGASASGYSVTYAIGGGAFATNYAFPFQLSMASVSQTFVLFANDTGKTQSAVDTESWNSLFL